MQKPLLGRILQSAAVAMLIGAALLATAPTTSRPAEARVFVGFGFGFPGFTGPPIYAPPPPLAVYRPPVVYAPPPVVIAPPAPVVYAPPPPVRQHYRRPVRHHRVCRCTGS